MRVQKECKNKDDRGQHYRDEMQNEERQDGLFCSRGYIPGESQERSIRALDRSTVPYLAHPSSSCEIARKYFAVLKSPGLPVT